MPQNDSLSQKLKEYQDQLKDLNLTEEQRLAISKSISRLKIKIFLQGTRQGDE